MKRCLVLKQVVALCFRRIIVAAVSIVNCLNEDSFTLQMEVYHTRLDISLKSTRPWDTRQYTLYTFCTSPIVLMDRSQMTQIRTWGGRRLMDQPSVSRDMMWAKNMPFLLLNEMWRQPKCPWCELSDDHAASERLRRMQDQMKKNKLLWEQLWSEGMKECTPTWIWTFLFLNSKYILKFYVLTVYFLQKYIND